MKKGFLAVTILLLVAVAICFFLNSRKTALSFNESSKQNLSASQPQNPNQPEKNPPTASSVLPANASLGLPSTPTTNLAANAGAVMPAPANAPEIPPAIVLENISRAVRQYGGIFGGNPVGTNPEITAALNGNNPKQISFIKPEAGMRTNENGELVDAWGTPFFFHQLSGMDMEIHSAGPDKIMWTSDDLITK